MPEATMYKEAPETDVLSYRIPLLRSDVNVLGRDIESLKENVSVLKSDMKTLKADVSDLKHEVSALKMTDNRSFAEQCVGVEG